MKGGVAQLEIRSVEGSRELVLDEQPLLSGSVVQLHLVRGGWVTGVLVWRGGDERPTFRMLLDGGTATAPLSVELPLPAHAVVRVLPDIR
jgi:hypothetical protein